MFLVEETKIRNLVGPVSIASGFSTVAVSMENYNHVTFIITTGVVASASSTTISFKYGATTAAASTALPLVPAQYYRNTSALASASVANDTFTKVTSLSTSSTAFKLVSQANGVYVIEIDANTIPAIGTNKAIGIAADNAGGATIAAVTAILSGSRYASSNPPSAL